MVADMLVKLYDLPPQEPVIAKMAGQGITIRHAIPPEAHIVIDWVRDTFGRGWASETTVAFSHQPVSCFIATEADQLIGFACYNATRKGFFGPTGVDEDQRGRGVGLALLLACMHAMYAEGYGYAIIGAAGPVDFYAKALGATIIPDSWPGIYRGLLRDS